VNEKPDPAAADGIDPAADIRRLSLRLSAEDLAKVEEAAGKHHELIEIWAAKALRRAIADS
jgi:hypothetical protein